MTKPPANTLTREAFEKIREEALARIAARRTKNEDYKPSQKDDEMWEVHASVDSAIDSIFGRTRKETTAHK